MSRQTTTTKLSTVADVLQGQSPESQYYSDSEGTPFLQGNRTFGNLYPSLDTYTKKVTKLAKEGEVLMSVRAPVGALNYAPCDLCIGRGLASIKAKNGDNRFIYYALKYNVENLIKQGGATTFDSVSKDLINDFELIIPSGDTDRRKVSVVLSAIDEKIELSNKINAELEQMAKTLYDYWFVQFDFPDANGKPYKSSGGAMVYNEELKREIPKDWNVASMSELIELERGISYTSESIESGEGTPMINLGSISVDRLYRPEKLKFYLGKHATRHESHPGELLIACTDMTRNGDIIGCPIATPYTHQSFLFSMDLAKVKFVSESALPSYLYFTLRTDWYHRYIKRFASGTNVQHLDIKGVYEYRETIPPIELQQAFDNLFVPLNKVISNSLVENQKLAELRDWLLPMLMNGQVTVK